MYRSLQASKKKENRKRPTRDDLLLNEGLTILALLAGILVVSVFLDAGPVQRGGPAPAELRAPWIFVGVQYLLRSVPTLLGGIVIPLLMLLALATIPFLRGGDASRPLVRVIPAVVLLLVLGTAGIITVLGLMNISAP